MRNRESVGDGVGNRIYLAGTLPGNGGIQTHLRWLVKALVEAGWQVEVLSLGAERLQECEVAEYRRAWGEGVPIREVGGGSGLLERIRQALTIGHAVHKAAPAVYFAVGTGWNLFLPVILAGGDRRLVFHEVMSGVPFGRSDSRWLVRYFFDAVVGQTETVAETFQRCFGWKGATAALPAFPEPLEVTSVLPRAETRRVPMGTARAALFGRLAPHKNALWLVRQWESLSPWVASLDIYGTGEEAEPIREALAKGAGGGRIRYLGGYPKGQAYADLIRSYDVTLLPTLGAEGAPLVLLESMACGVPFVAYGVGGIPDYGVGNPDVVVVDPDGENFVGSVAGMAQRLDAGAIDQARLQIHYEAHYSYARLGTRWLAYLQEIAGGGVCR